MIDEREKSEKEVFNIMCESQLIREILVHVELREKKDERIFRNFILESWGKREKRTSGKFDQYESQFQRIACKYALGKAVFASEGRNVKGKT